MPPKRLEELPPPLADRDPLRWILREQRTAFPVYRAGHARLLNRGDRIFLYTTRGCFHNPTRDRGRIIGEAHVVEPVQPLEDPIVFGAHEYPIGVTLRILELAPRACGIELAPLVPRLATFPDASSWPVRLRRALVPIASSDVPLLRRRPKHVSEPYASALVSYLT